MEKKYIRTAHFEDNKLVLTPHASEADMFRVAVCTNSNGDEWLEILRPGQVHPSEAYTWAISATQEGALEAHEDWF